MMGAIISKFRKEKSTYQKLESLEEKIKSIEAYTIHTQQRQKRVVGNFLVISIGLYVVLFIVYYFWFFPPMWQDRLVRATPLILFPIVIFLLKVSVSWYFQRKVNNNSKKLVKMKQEKKDLLEKVMEKETYKVAVEILNKFGDRASLNRPMISMAVSNTAPNKSIVPTAPVTVPRLAAPQRPLTSLSPGPPGFRHSITSTPVNHERSLGPFRNPNGNRYAPQMPSPILPPQQQSRPRSMAPYQSQKRLPFPIIDFDGKGVLEKMVDYLIGDGPANRFAMICSQCSKHNGMALEEEYFYKSFQCYSCGFVNPSRKFRPEAPVLPKAPTDSKNIQELKNSSSSSSTDDASDDDESPSITEINKKPVDDDVDKKEKDIESETETEKKEEEDESIENLKVEQEEEIPFADDEEEAKPIVEKKND